uniref:Leucine-rich repeat-containing N-terminal plant-type domain-containing protein n=1 Tax=Triticum urartu TaxID=4572 RepID=A0A8R7Q958_TRIUA
MGTIQLSCIQIAIGLLFLTQAKSTKEETSAHRNYTITSCISDERSALVTFRAGLSDTANRLSSWKGGDCCQWKGVHCSNITGRVIRLDLHGPDCHNSIVQVLGGNISSSLLGLQHLQYLDLSCNRFELQILEFLGSLYNLKYIDLSNSYFVGRVPPQLGNLSNLRYFSLDSTLGDTYSRDITWLSRLTSLQHLDMTFVNLSTIAHWLPVVNMLPFLKILRLGYCDLTSSPDSLQFSNLTSLEILDLLANDFLKRSTPNWFWGLTRLKYLDISASGLHGPFPDEIGNMTSMVRLDLSSNDLVGMVPTSMKNLCNLEELFLFENNINGCIAEFFQRLPSCSWNKLQTLDLAFTNLTGSLPTTSVPLSNLTILDLSCNKLTGPLPLWIGELTKLKSLYLGSNNLDGVIHEGHLSRLDMLDVLTLSDNSIAIVVSPAWVPAFNLKTLELRSCQLGPKFPMWLRWQRQLYSLDISNTSISDTLPDWFWVSTSSVLYINIRDNKIRGVLPSTMEFMRGIAMDFSSNQLTGPIPKLPTNLSNLDISRNNLVGPLPLDFGASGLQTLVLFDNCISGNIPSSLFKLQSLSLLDISGNNLTGSVPDCLDNESTINTTSLSIRNLSLRNNHLSGEFPSFLQSCNLLIFLDLSNNHFFGTLPTWIGQKLTSLAFLRLRSNMFYGHIPVELMKISNLQYLDLAYNNITGIIPTPIVNFKGMILMGDNDAGYEEAFGHGLAIGDNELVDYSENFTVLTKGQERLYTGEIIFMVNLDLSSNNLVGDIPEEIGSLVALKSLNLSWNAFSGKIPEKIGALVQVESLDLSHNKLSGRIPTSLSALTSLSRLNMSYNNLTGEVPSGNQLQTLEDPAYIYVGNPGLCGPLLLQKCPGQVEDPTYIPATQGDNEGVTDVTSFLLAMGSGLVAGLWVVFCIFLFKKKWRVSWLSLCDSMYDRISVLVAVTWASLTRKS